jgi:N-acetylglutamate synthase-like GNAT family acetyltransferase
MRNIRRCGEQDLATMLAIINDAALAYRGVIPADRWHEPYMQESELREEIAAGVEFWGVETDDGLIGVMGVQAVQDVELIRHAYIRPDQQRFGVGAELIEHLRRRSTRRMLVGTWAAATWAISFYQRHGFELAPSALAAELLRKYWTIPERQIETSVVLVLSV